MRGNNGMLAHDESMLSKEKAAQYLEKIKSGTITANEFRELFVCLSEEAQDSLFESLKGVLTESEWKTFVTHLRGYDWAMLGEFRGKVKSVKESMAIAIYDEFNEEKVNES